jgi:CheY-like chemotaxis protein
VAKPRILIIDDEVGFSRLLKLNLESDGQYEVRIENRGSQGYVAAKEFLPDMILLDVIMPDRDGGEVAAEIAADPRLSRTPLVFLTAVISKDEADARNGIIGNYPFLAKPVTVEAVRGCIKKHLGS